jgi:O-antigen/teichoic acid export membrane protein
VARGDGAPPVSELSSAEPLLGGVPADGADVLDTMQAGGRIVRGGALRFAAYVAATGLSVLSAALLTRHLGVARFGQYVTVLSLVGIVASVTDAGMSAIGTREFAVTSGARRRELMRDLLGLRMLLTSCGVLLVLAFALAAGYDSALLAGAILASLGTIALVVQHTHTIPISAELRLGTLSALDLARQALTVALIVVLIALDAGVTPLLAVALAVNLVLIPPTAALARHQISLAMGLRYRQMLELLRLTVAFSLAAAVGTLYVYAAQIVTSLVSSAHQSGLFAASFRIFVVVGAVPGLLVGGALPLLARAARDDRERLSYALERIFEVSLILGVAAALSTLAGAGFMIEVVGGREFAGAGSVLQIQGLALIASFVLAGWSYALLSLRLYRGVLATNLLAFVVSFVLTVVLAGSNGAKGAAVATVCGEATLALASLFVLTRRHPELRPKLGIVAKVAVAAAPAVALSLLAGVPSVVRMVLALALYGGMILLLRAIPAEVLELLPWRRPAA